MRSTIVGIRLKQGEEYLVGWKRKITLLRLKHIAKSAQRRVARHRANLRRETALVSEFVDLQGKERDSVMETRFKQLDIKLNRMYKDYVKRGLIQECKGVCN